MVPKDKKRKSDVNFVLEEMAYGCTVYENEHDDVGVCGFCHSLSYKEHKSNCPVQVAQEILEERRYGRR